MESDRFICVRETSPQNSVVIIFISMSVQPLRRPITADSGLMNRIFKVLALKGGWSFAACDFKILKYIPDKQWRISAVRIFAYQQVLMKRVVLQLSKRFVGVFHNAIDFAIYISTILLFSVGAF